MSCISVYKISLKDDSMVRLSGKEIRSDEHMPYSRWYEEYLTLWKCVGTEERDCSPSALGRAISQGKDISVRDRNEINGRWMELEMTSEPAEGAMLLIIKDVHERMVMERKKRRLEVYHFYRNRIKQMREKGFYCGLLILAMDKGGELCFAEKSIRQYLIENENSEVFTRLRKYITCPSFETKTGDCWGDGVECQNINLGSQGDDRWIQLYGSTVATESGRHYKYLMYMGMEAGPPKMTECCAAGGDCEIAGGG